MPAHRTILLLVSLSVAANAGAQGEPGLKTVMERAQNYVESYEKQLGTLIGQEDYSQTAKWDDHTAVVNGIRRSGIRVGTQRRSMSSDFLLTRIDGQWFAVRNVLSVDRRRVDGKQPDFARILGQSSSSAAKQLEEISAANRRYNIGDFFRTFNEPTFPLKILYSSNASRFVFEKGAGKNIGNVAAWEIRFSETLHPTMIHDLQDNDQAQHGRLWLDPSTGAVLKTETEIDYRAGSVWGKVTLVVTYKESSKLNMLVPEAMEERYDSEFHHVSATAIYSNFRRFETEVKLDIGPIEQ
jgi:hypothetical protein